MALLAVAERYGRYHLNRRGAASRFIETSAGRVHMYDAPGTDELPTIAVLHGFGSSATAYAPLITILRRTGARVVAPEAPAHGFSSDPGARFNPDMLFRAIFESLDQALDRPAVLFGNSLGGAAAIRYALDRPGRVHGLVVSSPAGARTGPRELDELRAVFDIPRNADARAFLARLFHRAPWYAPVIAPELRRVFARESMRAFLAAVREDDLFTPEQLARLTMPTTLIWGRSDRIMPRACLAYYRNHLPPHVHVEEPEAVGHCPHLERPEWVAEKILGIARKVAIANSP